MWDDLPSYLRRDYRRLYGEMVTVSGWELQKLTLQVRIALAHGKSVRLDGYQWRAATGFGARASLRMLKRHLGCGGDYRRRGDLIILYPEAA